MERMEYRARRSAPRMMRLEQEGLAHPIPTGGFAVSAFSERDIHAAIEVRGTLEGLAARLAAERGHKDELATKCGCVLHALDTLVSNRVSRPRISPAMSRLNGKFHQHVVDLADSAVLSRQIARAVALPFASASAFVTVQANLPERPHAIHLAQDHHRCVAACDRGALKVNAPKCIMREHARLARRNLELALETRKPVISCRVRAHQFRTRAAN